MGSHANNNGMKAKNNQRSKQSLSPAFRFKSDPSMNNCKMGKLTIYGWEVFDLNKKLIGYWN